MANKITLYTMLLGAFFVLCMHMKCPGQPSWWPAGVIENTIAGEAIPVFTAVYISTVDGKIYKADRNNATKTAVGITIDTLSANDTCQILRGGTVYNYPGAEKKNYYVGAAGALQTEKPGFGGVHRAAWSDGLNLYVDFLERREAEAVTLYKATDESRTSSPGLDVDGELVAALDSGATYVIDLFAFIHNADSLMGYQYRTAYTGTYSVAQYRRTYSQAGWELDTGIQAGDGTVPVTTANGIKAGTGFVQISQTITTTSAGFYRFLWGQAESRGNTITVRAGSYINVKRIK